MTRFNWSLAIGSVAALVLTWAVIIGLWQISLCVTFRTKSTKLGALAFLLPILGAIFAYQGLS